jgi:hypothetical protein
VWNGIGFLAGFSGRAIISVEKVSESIIGVEKVFLQS